MKCVCDALEAMVKAATGADGLDGALVDAVKAVHEGFQGRLNGILTHQSPLAWL